MSTSNSRFIYIQRYRKLTIKQKANKLIERLKAMLIERISSSRFKSSLDPIDRYLIENKNHYRNRSSNRLKYNDFGVDKIVFFEVLELDDLDKSKEILLSKFLDQTRYTTDRQKGQFRQWLEEVRHSLNSFQRNSEFSFIEFQDKQDADLLESARLGYIKTDESYLIITIEVEPSKKFKQIFQAIIDSDDYSVETIQYNSLKTIIKQRKFVSHSTVQMSSLLGSWENLVSDMSYQVKLHITDCLQGLFYDMELLPRLEHYEVGNVEEFDKDTTLSKFVRRNSSNFCLSDDKIRICLPLPHFAANGGYFIRVLKEKGHGTKKEQSESDLTDYDSAESDFLRRDLALPCALRAILHKHHHEILRLKRRVYDYINLSSKNSLLKRIQILKNSRRYINLKIQLAKNILLFKRFEQEFGQGQKWFFLNRSALSDFKRAKPFDSDSDERENLARDLQGTFGYQIKGLNAQISTLEQVFRPIEEVSVYRTNFWLQVTSIGVAVLAILLTADKAIEIFERFFK